MSIQAFNQIETWDGKKIKAALAQAKNDEALQQAIAERYMPILEHIGAKDLSALTTVANKLTTKKPLERDWQPDATSIEVLGSIPVEKIVLQKAKKFPEWLTYLGRLTELSLQECKKMSLPDSISRLDKLRELSMRKCALQEVPAPIRQLKGLKTLQLSSNEIQALPDWLAELPLEELSLSFNKIQTLPAAIGKIATLKLLDVAYNELTHLPESIGELRRLTRLEITGNKRLAHLPDEIAHLRLLRRLDASACALVRVPESLQHCTLLTDLDISLNLIAQLPDWLGNLAQMRHLNIANTQITELPKSILQLGMLCGLDIRKSPLAEKDVFQQTLDRKEVASYLQRLFSEKTDALIPFLCDLESRDEGKIQASLQALSLQPQLWARAERRYLPFIQTRLRDAKATLWQWTAVAISPDDEERLLQSGIRKGELISFLFMSGEQCRLLVDFVGAMAKPHIDAAQFAAKGSRLSSEATLMSYAHSQLESLHTAVQAAATLYTEGWFGRLYKAFASISINKLMFDHTNFEAANASPVLREFFCFVPAFAAMKRYWLDIFQSTAPDLTEIFWLLPFVPDTQWGDTSVELPRSPLSFKRRARVKEGDFADWREVPSTPQAHDPTP